MAPSAWLNAPLLSLAFLAATPACNKCPDKPSCDSLLVIFIQSSDGVSGHGQDILLTVDGVQRSCGAAPVTCPTDQIHIQGTPRAVHLELTEHGTGATFKGDFAPVYVKVHPDGATCLPCNQAQETAVLTK
jgi:hypothetical protein